MPTHLPSRLAGPITQARPWWPRTREGKPGPVRNANVPSLDDPNIRADLVRRVRAEIAAGTYETPEKWEAALERLLDRLGRE